ncbi:hypothetical protein FHG64_11620 [Antarcticibacterium flavum]|uniref:Uncharacterized protein n=1 Tax=Antarcticibacterium flavum TaxID=2058175 RepID=A0A5B7X366_9FLAO|nr:MULTISPECIES: DUF6544 family protein [Antarcticibacterium]MCM4161557.1 hypothetical protein [Antarcticibacterium sp. W02-3]QCY69994.1 hypothetical protein FHG64_11620 [Antarcticibacterium flavum]
MKILFSIILLLHGLLHFIGFAKAYKLASLPQLELSVSRSLGTLWLIAGIIFLLALVLFILDKKFWPFFALAGVLISQSLIIISWQDTKFGTILNIIILLMSIPALGNFHFKDMLKNEKEAFRQELKEPAKQVITHENLKSLPPAVGKWLETSGVVGKPKISYGYLIQRGEMRTSPDGNWMAFEAKQLVNLENPYFIWNTEVEMAPFITLHGRDKLMNGEGEMLIKLLSLVPVVDEGPGEKMNTGAMLRYLGEICWFPSAALSEHITWEETGRYTAMATLRIGETEVSGEFTFNGAGDMESFEALRYYGGGEEAKQEKWYIKAVAYREFSGYRIPAKCAVTWKLPEGDFNWLNLEITSIEYNQLPGQE